MEHYLNQTSESVQDTAGLCTLQAPDAAGGGPMENIAIRVLLAGALIAAPAFLAAVQITAPKTDEENSAEQAVRKLSQEEVEAFLHKDADAMSRIWSDDFVVTNPLNKFVNKQQVLGMVRSGFLVITSFKREIEYIRVYGDTVILAGSETVVWGGKMPNAG